jgi:hypothetical protein
VLAARVNLCVIRRLMVQIGAPGNPADGFRVYQNKTYLND